ncbi:hypothetical protein KPL38_12025 [Clostridium psychrophilum]|nr:hypothetical protein [Clostridium psychrophilum]
MANSVTKCMLTFFINRVDDIETRSILQHTLESTY